ncbi:fused isobutyryl-CoA mutase/GTPase IcmF [Cycloclasticus pugetii]|uniref:fused isobutyryl-CoA mutase/GTPase IcmF n=1 Tax=Cycloclasticus pugetii TaxID=34068 RepID=UPI002409E703|nr:fused isobutyryl-CoA mutase/GTPase IcmF [Cycloclasticus pugetii]MDF1828469.1 methylmalonyl-CoA mutase family protein [Cycloclasticus pugetii]
MSVAQETVVDPSKLVKYKANNHVRFITAASLFDGHDAAINIMRRILQSTGAEVIHLGHNRSVQEVVNAAIQEDVHGIAISSYQGGHVEYFKYMIDLLKEKGASHIKVFGGGGGVIVPEEIEQLHAYGVSHIFSPADGQSLQLQGIINEMIETSDYDLAQVGISDDFDDLNEHGYRKLSRLITGFDENTVSKQSTDAINVRAKAFSKTPVLGITGTGGAGKSSLTDELIRRFNIELEHLKIAVIAIDPTKRKTGGALLGDRIRMNAINHPNIYFRSIATRNTKGEVPEALPNIIDACKVANFDLIIVETPGIGQGDAGIVPFVNVSMYVMTPEFGAASQLEKIDMLDFADVVVINKFDRKGSDDAFRDVRKQYQRNYELFTTPIEELPIYGTIASKFNDDGVTALYQGLLKIFESKELNSWEGAFFAQVAIKRSTTSSAIIAVERQRYLAEIAETVRDYHKKIEQQVTVARERQQLKQVQRMLGEPASDEAFNRQILKRENALDPRCKRLLDVWEDTKKAYKEDTYVNTIRDKKVTTNIATYSLSGTRIPKVSIPAYEDDGERLRFLLKENLPGSFPYTAGVFNFKREGEDPARMFAGEGDPFRTNRRFKLLSESSEATRLSTAFDSVTLYGNDPGVRPDIYGKVGNSGVSIATLDDMKVLFDGFDLCAPTTSVSLTINGPAPTLLSFFLNTAIDQQCDKFEEEKGRCPSEDERNEIKDWALSNVRGTVQADILKEDQGQNTCIFSTEFSLKMMGDIQQYFIDKQVRNFYSVSISGYHIAEAGANPISQLAFTLSNGFTYVETYLSRGMHIDDFAANLSFFFSNGMDPEYTVMGRVARRIWAVAMRFKYGANDRSQKLKYHIQTSGRSLHAQEMDFNDIRTTLQALIAINDNCNSLHTNAYDEAVTTPTEESVRRAMAIQLIINKEYGLAKNENALQGAFIIEELTDLVEEAVLREFERISERGGVLGAMETGYQRGKIQDESMNYEMLKHTGELPIIGVNTFKNPTADESVTSIELARSTEQEKQSQLHRLKATHEANEDKAVEALYDLQQAVQNNENVFEVLMEAGRYCSLGQITEAFFEVGGQYRRNM